MFFLVFFQQSKVWTMEESQVEAVCELRWAMTSANFQGVETSPAVQFKPTNCPNCKCNLSPPPCDAGLPEQFWNYAEKLASVVSSYIVKEGEEISPF